MMNYFLVSLNTAFASLEYANQAEKNISIYKVLLKLMWKKILEMKKIAIIGSVVLASQQFKRSHGCL